MGHDLILHFREMPVGLHDELLDHDFQRMHIYPASDQNPVTIHYYHRFIPERSARGVWLYYHEGSYPVDLPDENADSAASATITTPFGANDSDRDSQTRIAYQLRDRYQARLFNPQTGHYLTD
jgi:hypothetical protein